MMKKYLLLCFFIGCIVTTNAQQNFEGEITYRTKIENEKDEELKIFFGVNKIKIIFYGMGGEESDKVTIIFIDSAATFDVSKINHSYKKKLLNTSKPNNFATSKLICGLDTKAVQAEPNLITTLLGNFLKIENTTYYLSDKLIYNVPSKYINNAELAMLQGNKIILGLNVNMLEDSFNKIDSAKKIISVEAVSVKPMHIADTVFAIPANYNDEDNVTNATKEDATKEAIKEDEPIQPRVADVKLPLKKPATKRTKNKPTANKRKQ
jgi:hypothetical protein